MYDFHRFFMIDDIFSQLTVSSVSVAAGKH